MKQLKRKIMFWFLLFSGVIAIFESVLDSVFTDRVFEQFTQSKSVFGWLLFFYLLLAGAIFVLFAWFFWKLSNQEIQKESQRQLKEKNLQYSRICHDLKTPMTSIRGYSSALRDGKIPREEREKAYQLLVDKSIYLNELIDNLFTYASLETPEYTLKKEKLDLAALVRAVVAFEYDEIEKRQIDLVLELPENPMYVVAAEKELKRAASNLITNVWKHNPERTKLLVRLIQKNNQAILTIADTGITIPEETAEEIFDPYVCGDSSRSSKGHGLGLSITRAIASKHQGTLALDTKIKGYKKAFVMKIPAE